jgi:hypothetical protein
VGEVSTVAARERVIPIAAPLVPLVPEGGLMRGRVVGCTGPAAMSVATALVASASAAGSWAALVGLTGTPGWFGAEAAASAGWCLERVVAVAVDRGRPAVWAEAVAAALDGFEIVVAAPPLDPARAASVLRRVQQRVRARSAVLVLVDVESALGSTSRAASASGVERLDVDLLLDTTEVHWHGVGAGSGHLRGRRVQVVASGRRAPRPTRVECWLPGPDGALAPARIAPVAPVSPGEVAASEAVAGEVSDVGWERAG